jgi:hypothetical protein
LATQRSLQHTGAEISQEEFDGTRIRLDSDSNDDNDDENAHVVNVHVVDVHVVVGAIDHGDHGDHCLQPVGSLHLAPEEKPVALFHEEESGSCCLFLAVRCVVDISFNLGFKT